MKNIKTEHWKSILTTQDFFALNIMGTTDFICPICKEETEVELKDDFIRLTKGNHALFLRSCKHCKASFGVGVDLSEFEELDKNALNKLRSLAEE